MPDPRASVVWLIDDSPLQLAFLERALGGAHVVRTFDDGAAALEALAIETPPELLIIDWRMPAMSGVEVCRFVRTRYPATALPILIVTSSGSDAAVVEAFEAGANDFVAAPFLVPALVARVDAHIRLKRLHDELAITERRLRVEAQFRENFVGMLAHDLRQPLNTLSLANGAIEKRAAGTGLEGLLAIQKRATDRMGRMVVDLLDLTRSRPEVGMPIDAKPTDLGRLVQSLLEDLRVTHPEQAFELRIQGQPHGEWDPDRLAQLFGNLLGNAIENGTPGSAIEIEVDGAGEGVVARVINRGEPIPAELLPHLFEAYRQGRGGKSGGIGLGLFIASAIVRAHRGTITVRTGDRTVFEFTLPRR